MNQITLEMIGDEADEALAERMAGILTRNGYPTEFLRASGMAGNAHAIPDDVWQFAMRVALNPVFAPVRDHLGLMVRGKHRSINVERTYSIEELLEKAQAADGVYGADNEPVSEDMLVKDLLDWHIDYTWEIAE